VREHANANSGARIAPPERLPRPQFALNKWQPRSFVRDFRRL